MSLKFYSNYNAYVFIFKGVKKKISGRQVHDEDEDVMELSSTKGFYSFCKENKKYCRPDFVISSAMIP